MITENRNQFSIVCVSSTTGGEGEKARSNQFDAFMNAGILRRREIELVKTAILFLVVMAIAGLMIVKADAEIYFAQDTSPYPPVTQGGPNDVPRPNIPNCRQTAAQFYARIANRTTETFESFNSNSIPSAIPFGTNAALFLPNIFNPTGIMEVDDTNRTQGGIIPTSGTKCLLLAWSPGVTDNVCSITFSAPQSAFGFMATDIESNVLLRQQCVRDKTGAVTVGGRQPQRSHLCHEPNSRRQTSINCVSS